MQSGQAQGSRSSRRGRSLERLPRLLGAWPWPDRPGRVAVRPAACLALAVIASAALIACGSSSSSGNTAASTTTSTSSAAEETATQATSSESTAASASAALAAEASVPTPGCRHVPPPPSRASETASKPTKALAAARTYTVHMQTNCGPIEIQLAVKEAPEIAASFAHLVQSGYYNDLTFHRIVSGFVIQGGDPNGNGTGGPSWQIVEPPPANFHYTKGVVAMAKSGNAPAGASGSQFFIVTGASVNLPPVYALAGRVVGGEQAVEAIARVPTEAAAGGELSKPRVPVVIERATLSVR